MGGEIFGDQGGMGYDGGDGGGFGDFRRRNLQNQSETDNFNETIYEQDILRISRYLKLYGMFEVFNGKNYSVHDKSVNENLFTWKSYDNVIQMNTHGQYELRFNLSDAVIQGTAASIRRMDLVKSNYQLRANIQELKSDAYLSCAQNKFGKTCLPQLDNLGKATGNMRRWIMANYKSLSAAQKLAVDTLNTNMDEIIKSKDETKINEFLSTYHYDHLLDYGQPYMQT